MSTYTYEKEIEKLLDYLYLPVEELGQSRYNYYRAKGNGVAFINKTLDDFYNRINNENVTYEGDDEKYYIKTRYLLELYAYKGSKVRQKNNMLTRTSKAITLAKILIGLLCQRLIFSIRED